MGFGYSPKLPIQSGDDGQALNKTAMEAIKQNVKMLVLTVPGERMMDPKFGVGLRRFMFRPMVEDTFNEIATKVRAQFALYMPFVKFSGIHFLTSAQDSSLGENGIKLRIVYSVPNIGETDALELFETAGSSTAVF